MKNRALMIIGGRVLLAACLFAGVGAMLLDVSNIEPVKPAPQAITGAALKNPLDAELLWCRHLGDEALRDKECLRAWSQNRERFFQKDPREISPKAAAKKISDASDLKKH